MRLHIKVLQIYKQGQALGKTIKNKKIASAVVTQYEGFDSDWVWSRTRKLWPEEITGFYATKRP